MGTPVIDRIEVVPSTIPPGGQSIITVFAHDDDNATVAISGTVRDSQGNSRPFTGTVNIGDPLTYAVNPPAIGTISPHPDKPNAFIYTAPV